MTDSGARTSCYVSGMGGVLRAWLNNTPTKVVVIGGGYAGTLAANHLRLRADVDITLVNPRPTFVERLRLHQFAAGTGDATVDYGTLLGEGVQLVVDSATRIDTASRTVQLASGGELDYDYVIYAVGSTGMTPAAVPGAAEFAYPVAELEQAQRLRGRRRNGSSRPVTVVGAGLTGIETAAELTEQGRSVALVCGGRLAPSFSAPARRSVAKDGWPTPRHGARGRRGGGGVAGCGGLCRRCGASQHAHRLDGGVRGAGAGRPQRSAHRPVGQAAHRRDADQRRHDRIVAAGDSASPSGRPLRMSCYAALPTDAHTAGAVLSRIAAPSPPRWTWRSRGRASAWASEPPGHSSQDDTPVNYPRRPHRRASIKEAWHQEHGAGHPPWEARKPGSVFWLKGGKRPNWPAPAPEVVQKSATTLGNASSSPSAAAAADRLRRPRLRSRIRRRAADSCCGGSRSAAADKTWSVRLAGTFSQLNALQKCRRHEDYIGPWLPTAAARRTGSPPLTLCSPSRCRCHRRAAEALP